MTSEPMTDTAELIARATEEADYLERMNVSPLSTRTTLRDLADALSSLVRERDEALKDLNRYAWERDKAREERDKTERRAEAFWKPQLHAAQADAARMREALEPFARVADMEERAEPFASVMVNVDRCRDARASLSNTSEGGKGAV